jgi:flagellum-specific peptidoglycan hydrolase FlgJ
MANNNLDNINIDNLKSFNDILRLNTAGMTSYERGQQKLINEEKDQEKKLAKLIDSGEKFGQELIGIGKSLTTGSSSFGPLTKTITLLTSLASGMASKFGSVGKAVGQAIKLAGKVANTTIETFEKTYTGFEKLSQSGLVSSFDEIDDISSSTMITINDLSELLEGQGQILSSWSGTAFNGIQEFKKLSGSLLTSRVDFQLLGITTKELAASQIKYMDYERKITGERQKFDAKHIERFKQYLNNITDISIMTGERREEVQKEIDARQEEASYRIFVGKRTIEQNLADNKLLEVTKFAFGPITEKGIRDLMVGLKQGVIATSDEADVVRQHYGRLGIDILADLQKHINSPLGQVNNVVDTMKRTNVKNVQVIGNQAMMAGDTLDSKVAVELRKGAQFAKLNQKDIEDMIQAGKTKPPTTTDEALARARIDMGDNNLTIQRLSMSIPLVTKSMRLISKAMNSLIKGVFNQVGKNIPELLIVMEDQDNVRDKITDSITELAEYNKRQIKAQEKINARKAAGKSGYFVDKSDKKEIEDTKNLIILENINLRNLEKREKELAAKKLELEILKGYKTEAERSRPNSSSSSQSGGSPSFKGPQKEFFQNIYTAIYSEAKKAGVPNPEAIAMLGATQSALETGYGKSLGGGNNYFGIKDFSNGKMVTINQPFMTYSNMNESAADYVRLLTSNSRYKDVVAAKTASEAIAAQGKSGYATDPDYAKKLSSIYSSAISKENENNQNGQAANSKDYQGLNIGGKYPGEAIAGGSASNNIIALARKFQNMYPGGTFSAFNDTMKRGTTAHKDGLAFDYTLQGVPRGGKISKAMSKEITDFLKNSGASKAIDEYNDPSSQATGGHIHAEVTARTGGIFDGPSTGYLIELHGRERMMIIPDNDGNSNMFYGKKQKQSDKLLANLISMIDSNVDEMINLMNDKISLQERMKSS